MTLVSPAPLGENTFLALRVVRRREEAEGVISLVLEAIAPARLPAVEAGAHLEIRISPTLSRSYSLSNDPSDEHAYRLGVLLEPQSRGGSEAVHRHFMEGHVLQASMPKNNFRLEERATRSILLAGGIGITPMLAMAYRLRALGQAFELHYCCRTRAKAAFVEELMAQFGPQTFLHVDDGAPPQRFDGEHTLRAPEAGTHLYVCGPTGFMDHVTGTAERLGWPRANVHTEYFGAAVDTGGHSFCVRAERSGVSVVVGPGQSIAQALCGAGVQVPLSCEQGVCGTCLVGVLAGVPDHRDLFQTDEEKAANTHITPCCSRSLGAELVLDL